MSQSPVLSNGVCGTAKRSLSKRTQATFTLQLGVVSLIDDRFSLKFRPCGPCGWRSALTILFLIGGLIIINPHNVLSDESPNKSDKTERIV